MLFISLFTYIALAVHLPPIEHFKDIHFYRFGKPVKGSNASTCDMAWRFRPKEGKAAAFYKDYRRFVIARTDNKCNFTVVAIGDYHSGGNARKRKKNQKGFEKKTLVAKEEGNGASSLPVVGEVVNDSLPVVESEDSFSSGKYLLYNGVGDRCKIYSTSNQDEEGKDFRFYFDFEHLKESAGEMAEQDALGLYLVEDLKITPMKLADVKDTLIMRKFGSVEPDNYWYRDELGFCLCSCCERGMRESGGGNFYSRRPPPGYGGGGSASAASRFFDVALRLVTTRSFLLNVAFARKRRYSSCKMIIVNALFYQYTSQMYSILDSLSYLASLW
ncbi:hypothetical protein IFM89_039180 [Coptis chinensis]|uniref:Uncharacterized protein n=1 Tax=Coptis chinensis TaxID=261450 RepID=A0A835H1H9_9MAGN|nr:hypothetical protein IFM89_039180 [Coptis chinensis]